MRRGLIASVLALILGVAANAFATGAVTGIVVTGTAAGNTAQHATATIAFNCDVGVTTANMLVSASGNNQLNTGPVGAHSGNFSTAYTGTCGSSLTIWVWAQYEVQAQVGHTLAACVTVFGGDCGVPASTATVLVDPVQYNVTTVPIKHSNLSTITMVRSQPILFSRLNYGLGTAACNQNVQVLDIPPATTLQWQAPANTTIYNCGPQSFSTWNGNDFPATFAVGGAGGQTPPTLTVSPNPVPRGATATFTVQNATGGAMSNWSFTTTNYPTVTRVTNTGSGTWAGTMAAPGAAHVTVVLNGITYNLSANLDVTARSWGWTNLSPTEVGNGTIFNLPSPPVAGSAEGYSLLDLRFSFATTTITDNGPNQGFQYVSTLSSSAQGVNSTYRYEIVPDLEQNNSDFYRAQCGNYNAATNTGFVDRTVLRSNVQQHEYGTVLGHYQQYIAAQSVPANNIGFVAEPQLAGPDVPTNTFVSNVQQSLNTAMNTVTSAMSVEACNSDVRLDTSCAFRGFINFSPYVSCR